MRAGQRKWLGIDSVEGSDTFRTSQDVSSPPSPIAVNRGGNSSWDPKGFDIERRLPTVPATILLTYGA